MTTFRLFLAAYLAVLVVYTFLTISAHGWNLLAVFFGDIAAVSWPGQFNTDFLGFLMLSAMWVAWRHRFSPAGLGLAVLAFFGGMAFLAVYLLLASRRASTIRDLLLPKGQAAS